MNGILTQTCTSTCGPFCALQGNVILELPPDVPMNTTSPNDIFTGFMPYLGDVGTCNSILWEARLWVDGSGWTWVPGANLGIPSATNQSIYSSPILYGVGNGLCVLKHRFQADNIGIARSILDGKQIRITQPQAGAVKTCTTTFQLDGCLICLFGVGKLTEKKDKKSGL